MKIHFYKYQGAGNDFILIDDRENLFPENNSQLVETLCNRRFGIGADGLMLLRNHPNFNFEMIYYNSDGNPSSMCGNGGRCLAAFAQHLNIIQQEGIFLAVDGPHSVSFNGNIVSLQMIDVPTFTLLNNNYILHTGSPHYIQFVEDVQAINVYEQGRKIRYSKEFEKEGINVNFVQITPQEIIVRTYERGVEDETLSCGTGVTAASMAFYLKQMTENNSPKLPIKVKTLGGNLSVSFEYTANKGFEQVVLSGPATMVYQGTINI